MAQVQRQPEYPIPNAFNRDPPGFHTGSLLPAINAVSRGGEGSSERIKLPSIQLPPIRDAPPQRSSNLLSITNLLSRNPDSPKERDSRPRLPQQARPQQARPQPPIQPFPRSDPYLQNDARHHVPNNYAAQHRYLDESPMTFRPPVPSIQPPVHQPQPSRYRPPGYELERSHLSPATSVDSYRREPYTSSTEPSPVTSAALPFTLPAQRKVSQPPSLNYTLNIRQQPAAARACGFGERDRRVIDPPPILELKITDRLTGALGSDPNAMLALHCTLLSHDGKEDETEVPPTEKGMPTTRRLMGTLVASPYQAKDENGVQGTFFVFSDLSCRSPGKYRLRFKLLRVDPMMMVPGAVHASVASIVTDIFSVFTAKDFPGMRASSQLLKALRRQGLNVGVKKGSEARKGRGKTKKENSSEDEDDDGSEAGATDMRRSSIASADSESTADTSSRSKQKKKGKRRKREA